MGGLLSAHLMSKRGGLDLEPGWPCSGPLLRLAEDVARRLLPGMIDQLSFVVMMRLFLLYYILFRECVTIIEL